MGIEVFEQSVNNGRDIEAPEMPSDDKEVAASDSLSNLLEEKNRLAKMLGEAEMIEDSEKSLELKKDVYELLNKNREDIAKAKVDSSVEAEVGVEEEAQIFDEDGMGADGAIGSLESAELERAKIEDEKLSKGKVAIAREVIESEGESSGEVLDEGGEEADLSGIDEKMPKSEGGQEMNRREFLGKVKDIAKVAAVDAVVPGGLIKSAEAVSKVLDGDKENSLEKLGEEWERYKETVEGSGVRKNIEFLEEEYGVNAMGMTFLTKHHLALFDQLSGAEKEGSSVSHLNQGNLLSSAIKEFHTYWDREQLDLRNRKHEQEEGLNAQIEGFDRVPGWTNEKLQAKLEESHNKRWLYGNISSFEYIDKEKEAKTFSVAGEAHSEDLAGIFYKSGKEKVKIYKVEDANQEELFQTISHEIAHHQDWANNNCMPLQERLQFLREVTEHFQSPERFHSVYVEVDTPDEYSDLSEEEIKYRQLREYWAVLVERYDSHGEILKEHQPNDFDLVDRWKKRISEEP